MISNELRVGLLLFLASLSCEANHIETGSVACPTKSLYFGNGVWTTSDDAFESVLSIQTRLKESMTSLSFSTMTVDVAYNRSSSKFGDVAETAGQILGAEWPSLLMAHLSGLSRLGRFVLSPFKKPLNEALAQKASEAFLTTELSREDIASFVTRYTTDIGQGRKVVVVAHSQGNIFANRSFRELSSSQKDSFAVIPVASPDSVVEASYIGHVTFFSDIVISAVQALRALSGLPLAPLPNDHLVEVAPFEDVPDGHRFLPYYLTDTSSTQFILNGVISSFSSLGAPDQCRPSLRASPRIVRVNESSTLIWNTRDVDERQCSISGPDIGSSLTPLPSNFGVDDEHNGSWRLGPISGQVRYTLSCPNGSSSTVIEILPIIFES